jgi:phage-related minor tail protein
MGDYFNSFANSIAQAWSRTMGDMVAQWIMAQASMETEGGLMSLIGGLFVGAKKGVVFGAEPFAKGDVFGSPRLFRFAQGVGMLGEAGPEGVLPLKRTASGDLGVIATGGGAGGNVTVNINNESGQQVKAKSSSASFDAQGWVINVVLDGINRDVYGLRTALGRA